MYKVITTYRNGTKIISIFDSLIEANRKATELFLIDSRKSNPEFFSIVVDKTEV